MYEEGGLRQGRGHGCPPTPPLYIGARGEEGRPRVSLGGGGQADWISLGKILGRLAPQAKQVEAPHLPK